jgi:hypothetical protein
MLLLPLLAAAGAESPRPADLKTFRDWVVGCDNGRACAAAGLMPEQDFEAATAGVTRSPDANAAADVWINVVDGTPAAALVDGRRFALRAGPDAGYRAVDPAGLLAALTVGKKAMVVDSAGKPLGTLSTAGVAAALLYMDEKQGRLGNVTALVRKGPASASALPPVPALPVIAAAPASSKPPRRPTAAQIKEARGDNACEKAADEQPAESWRLDARHSLVLVPAHCGSGAYNMLSVPLLLDESGKATKLAFGGDIDGVWNADWDPKARRLGTYSKGRGIGDCGVTQVYAWDGAAFRLVEQTEMSECRGSMDYITTWRARVKE